MSTTGKQQAEALLGDLLVRSKLAARGEPPTDEELALLTEGRLGRARREEVISHLLTDPVRYQQWLDLSEMAADTAPAVSQRRSLEDLLYDWFEHWQFAAASAGAVAALLVLAVYIGLAPPKREADMALSDSAGLTPMTTRPAPALKRETSERKMLAKQAAPAALMEEAVMADVAAGAAMEATPAPAPCVALLHPQSQEHGWLCLVNRQQWQWQGNRQLPAAATDTLDNLDDSSLKENPRLSGDQRWLAYISRLEEQHELRVVSVAGLFGGDIRVYHFDPEGHGIDYRWDDNQLLIYSSKRFVTAGAAEREQTQAGLPQRFDPESGQFIQP